MSNFSIDEQRKKEVRVGQWYYAGLCVECRVCGAGVGDPCTNKGGSEFAAGRHKHHFWRYRDVRTLIGRQLEGGDYTDVETWRARKAAENELVNA